MTTIEAPHRTTVTTADIFRRAAYLLDEFGWRQGSPGSREAGSMCAVGAIWEAGREVGLGSIEDVVRHAWTVDIEGYERSVCDVVPLARWNDEPERSKAEVVAELRRLAEVAA